jgi:hypothetical protein
MSKFVSVDVSKNSDKTHLLIRVKNRACTIPDPFASVVLAELTRRDETIRKLRAALMEMKDITHHAKAVVEEALKETEEFL